MIDIATEEALPVRISGFGIPYLIVDVRQVEEVKEFLDAHGYIYHETPNAVTLDGQPSDSVLNLGKLTPQRLAELKKLLAA